MEDYLRCEAIDMSKVDSARFPHVHRWHIHISSLKSKLGMFDMWGNPILNMVPVVNTRSVQCDTALATPAKAPKQLHQQKQHEIQSSKLAAPSAANVKFFCVLDFEKTCEDREKDNSWGPQEIIEFPSVLLRRAPCAVLAQFQSFVKPRVNPALTPFCTTLTGITQEQVDSAEPLMEVLKQHHTWLREYCPLADDCIFVTCGDMDLKTSLPEDPNVVGEDVHSCYKQWLNIKKEFGRFYTQWYKKGKQPRNMTEMLERLDIALEGQHHSGIDDCRNITKVLERMIAGGWSPA